MFALKAQVALFRVFQSTTFLTVAAVFLTLTAAALWIASIPVLGHVLPDQDLGWVGVWWITAFSGGAVMVLWFGITLLLSISQWDFPRSLRRKLLRADPENELARRRALTKRQIARFNTVFWA